MKKSLIFSRGPASLRRRPGGGRGGRRGEGSLVWQSWVEAPPAERLGGDLRALRRRRGLTLAALAAKVGCSVGWLSQAERGLSELSVDDLRDLCKALRVPLSWFLTHNDIEEEERGTVVRWGRRRIIGSPESGLTECLLSPDLDGSFEMLLSVFAPGAERRHFITRQTEETGYVMSGELELWIGSKHFHVRQGDSFRIAGEPHRWRNPGKEACEVVWVVAPPVY